MESQEAKDVFDHYEKMIELLGRVGLLYKYQVPLLVVSSWITHADHVCLF